MMILYTAINMNGDLFQRVGDAYQESAQRINTTRSDGAFANQLKGNWSYLHFPALNVDG